VGWPVCFAVIVIYVGNLNNIKVTMARVPKAKLELPKKAFTEDAMTPGQAAEKVGVTYATATRYYEKWSEEITRSLERKLVPSIEESIKKLARKRTRQKRRRSVSKH
jgi:hypothetical protein